MKPSNGSETTALAGGRAVTQTDFFSDSEAHVPAHYAPLTPMSALEPAGGGTGGGIGARGGRSILQAHPGPAANRFRSPDLGLPR